MDDRRFDALTKTLGTAHSRRHLTRLLAGLSLGGALSALGATAVLAAKLNGGASCSQDRECKTGTCLGNDTCSCSEDFPRCTPPTNPCKRAVCDDETGRCRLKNKRDGSYCGYNQVCEAGACTFCIDQSCTSNDQCCTDYCLTSNGTCECWAGNQRPSPSGCTSNPQCCNGKCNKATGTCACDPNGSPCFFDDSCCSRNCVNELCHA